MSLIITDSDVKPTYLNLNDVESDAIFCRVKTYCCCWHFICCVVTSDSDLVDELCVFVVDATILKDMNQISVYIMHIVSCK